LVTEVVVSEGILEVVVKEKTLEMNG